MKVKMTISYTFFIELFADPAAVREAVAEITEHAHEAIHVHRSAQQRVPNAQELRVVAIHEVSQSRRECVTLHVVSPSPSIDPSPVQLATAVQVVTHVLARVTVTIKIRETRLTCIHLNIS